jgi:hypothetical protein
MDSYRYLGLSCINDTRDISTCPIEVKAFQVNSKLRNRLLLYRYPNTSLMKSGHRFFVDPCVQLCRFQQGVMSG